MAEQEQRPGGDLYAVLGLTQEATSQQIRASYQQLAGDIVAGQASPIQRQAIEEAFETLGDPIRRLRYDAQTAAPAPPRFQMPEFRLPGMRLSIQLPSIPRLRRLGRRPDLPHVDPMLAAAIALVVIVGLTVLLLPLFRGRANPSVPAQSVADLVTSPTPLVATPAAARAVPSAPATGLVPGLSGGPGTSLVPLPPSALPGGLFGSPQPGGLPGNEPPFLTGSAIIDMLRAVVAATAVRNGPSQAAAGPLPGNPPSGLLVSNPAPAGIPITSVGSVPPIVGAAPPGTTFAGAPPAPTATPVPNHIAVPAGQVSALGAPPATGARAPGAATSTPNRFVPPPAGSP